MAETSVLIRDAKGRFGKGGPGRLPGYKNMAAQLDAAIKQVEHSKGGFPCPCRCTTLLQHFIRRAAEDDGVLVALLKKQIPDLQHQTGATPPAVINVIYGHAAPRVQVAEALQPDGNGHG